MENAASLLERVRFIADNLASQRADLVRKQDVRSALSGELTVEGARRVIGLDGRRVQARAVGARGELELDLEPRRLRRVSNDMLEVDRPLRGSRGGDSAVG